MQLLVALTAVTIEKQEIKLKKKHKENPSGPAKCHIDHSGTRERRTLIQILAWSPAISASRQGPATRQACTAAADWSVTAHWRGARATSKKNATRS